MASSSSNVRRNPVEVDPSNRYLRYDMIIGEGATKKVYLGFDVNDGKEVAWSKAGLKPDMLANEDLLERLYAEAELLKSLRHENVVRCFHSWIDKEEKVINMITEFLPSGNLGEYIRRNYFVRVRAIKYWCTQILKGLEYLHSLKITHRDVSCDNIFIDGISSTVKIGEMGLTLIYEQEGAMQSFSCRPKFVAPELLQGEGSYSQLIDIYSFGMCVLQMVTGETPYSECTDKQNIHEMVRDGVMPVALSEVTQHVIKQFIEKCLRPASERPTASDLLKDSFLRSSDSSTEAGSSSQSMSLRLRGKFVDSGPFKMTLYSDSLRVDFDFSVENDTTQEVVKRFERFLNLCQLQHSFWFLSLWNN